jgi:hypothetical protein
MRRVRRIFFCAECHALKAMPLAPFLIETTWLKFASKRDLLCRPCMVSRAAARHVDVTLADLPSCDWNLVGEPHSWFDRFAKDAPLDVIERWWQEYSQRKEDRALHDELVSIELASCVHPSSNAWADACCLSSPPV